MEIKLTLDAAELTALVRTVALILANGGSTELAEVQPSPPLSPVAPQPSPPLRA